MRFDRFLNGDRDDDRSESRSLDDDADEKGTNADDEEDDDDDGLIAAASASSASISLCGFRPRRPCVRTNGAPTTRSAH